MRSGDPKLAYQEMLQSVREHKGTYGKGTRTGASSILAPAGPKKNRHREGKSIPRGQSVEPASGGRRDSIEEARIGRIGGDRRGMP